jgi:hypothetical protein
LMGTRGDHDEPHRHHDRDENTHRRPRRQVTVTDPFMYGWIEQM